MAKRGKSKKDKNVIYHKKYWLKWYKKNKKRYILLKKLYREKNKQKIKKQVHKYYIEHKEEITKKSKYYLENHKKQRNVYLKKYRLLNKQKLKIYKTNYEKNKRHNDIGYRLASYLRTRIWNVLRGNNKSKSTIKLIGCSIVQLKQHLQSKFTKGMSWSNYGKWHIDHIRPCASFDLSKPKEQYKGFNYKNLQPLWAEDNLRKRRK